MSRPSHRAGAVGCLAAGLAALTIGVAACGSSGDGGAATNNGGKGDSGPLKVASILSLTGPLSLYGVLNKEGVDAAVKQVNADGGIDGRKLAVQYFDDRSRPEVAADVARQIGSDKSFIAVAGTGSTAATSPAAIKMLQNLKVPTVSNIATGSREDFDGEWIFHTAPSYDNYANATMDLASKYLHKTKLGVIYTTDLFGKSQVEEMKKSASDYGVELTAAEGTTSDVKDAKPAIRRIIDAGANVLVAISVTPAADTVYLNNWADLGKPVPFIGNIGYTAAKQAALAEDATKAITAMPGFILADSPLPRQETFVKALQAAGKSPQFLNAAGWDATMVVTQALKSHHADRADALKGLETAVQGFEGADGIYTFSKDRHQGFDPSALIWEKYEGDGKFGYYEPWAKDNVPGFTGG